MIKISKISLQQNSIFIKFLKTLKLLCFKFYGNLNIISEINTRSSPPPMISQRIKGLSKSPFAFRLTIPSTFIFFSAFINFGKINWTTHHIYLVIKHKNYFSESKHGIKTIKMITRLLMGFSEFNLRSENVAM